MKRIGIIAVLLALISLASVSQETNRTYFLYPSPPESMTNFYQRCNFMTDRFWDNCNLKSAFSSRVKMKGAFEDYISIAAHATVDTVMMSFDKLIKEVSKTPKNLLTLGEIAEECLYSDSAQFKSEQMYLPFAQAVADCRKLSSADRARFARQAKILSNSQVGMIAPDIEFTRRDGSKGHLNDVAGRIILFFNDPDCDECNMLMVRLSADYNRKQLHERGYLTLVSIYPGEADEEWKNRVMDYPENWVVGASANVDELFDLESTPVIVYLTPDHKILSKDIDHERLLEMIRILNSKTKAGS